ncbi:MAG: undecaprenyl-phosphate galactose phosphotransferase WbaP [Chloroflexota bacterium]
MENNPSVEKRLPNNKWIVSVILIFFDLISLYGIFSFSAITRNVFSTIFKNTTLIIPVINSLEILGLLLCFLIFSLDGLYPGYGLTSVKELQRMAKAITLLFLILAGITFLIRPFQAVSRAFLLSSWLSAIFVLPVVHFLLRNRLSRFTWYGYPVVIFGEGSRAEKIKTSLLQVRRLGWRPVLVLPVSEIGQTNLSRRQFEIAIYAPVSDESLEKHIRQLNLIFPKVVLIRETNGLASVWVEPYDLDGHLGMAFHYNLLDRSAILVKSIVDLVIGWLILLLLSPLMVFICAAIILDSPGPLFFCQERIGKGGKKYNIIKFRTMTADAELILKNLLESDQSARNEYEMYHKITNDPRITKMGNWLRKYSLDELPQLFNVIKGEMSLIGPRPYLPEEAAVNGEKSAIVTRVLPGVTGWWQVMGRHETTFQQRVTLDEYYIGNWSLWMDFFIVLKTFWVILRGKGV